MPDFTQLIDLASERLGGVVLSATDEFFAPKEGLLKASEPIWIADKYVDTGKWMDGWETRRHRAPDHDWCEIKLGAPGIIRGIVVDTAFYTGNFPESCSLEASDNGENWTEILAQSTLKGDAKNNFEINNLHRYTHLRFHIYPDGGVARLRVYGEPIPESLDGFTDLAAAHNGGLVVEASDMHYGSRHNLIYPGRSTGMHDGWETRRRRGPGHDWALIQLATEGEISRIEVDTLHFKGNFPQSCSLETEDGREILQRTSLGADTNHVFETGLARQETNRVRFHIYPDGGVSRLRLWGRKSAAGREEFTLRLINSLTSASAERKFLECCGSRRWANAMATACPFDTFDALLETAVRVWNGLAREDALEAFAAHPRIGEKTADQRAAAEQSGTATATAETLAKLERLNLAYAAKFGFIFIICAAGKSADDMLAQLHQRLSNGATAEFAIAAQEQRNITQMRICEIGHKL
jgi:allantoicase